MVDIFPCSIEPHGLHVEHLNDVTLIRLTRTDPEGAAIQAVGNRLFHLAETLHGRRFVLSLDGVHCLCSAMLGKLIAFHKKVKHGGGQLTLCALTPELSIRFDGMRLNRLFHICSTEEEALGPTPTSVV
jgi:anti-anti-sigma factor